IGSAVVISSCAVHRDERGRSFETQDEPGEDTYSTAKVALEQELLGAAAVDAAMGATSELITIDGEPPRPGLGQTPWSTPRPVVLDMSAAERELGYRAATGYVESLPETVEWTARQLADGRDWREAFPLMAKAYALPRDLFDYATEDAWLAEGGRGELGGR
ncbi:hypothetical protein AB4Z54_49060, partial [Streptomyces sp. MCAF7]